MRKSRLLPWIGILLVGVGLLIILVAVLGTERRPAEQALTTRTAAPSQTPEPIIPTRTPIAITVATTPSKASTQIVESTRASATTSPTDVIAATATATAMATTTTTPPPVTLASTHVAVIPYADLWQGRPRWGVGVSSGSISDYNVGPLQLGWYLNWGTRQTPSRPGGIEYVQMVKLKHGSIPAETLIATAQANPGSLWLIGNEPDVKWQDNAEPAAYAQLYHEAYTTLKSADPTAQVAIGGVSQPTPLRMRYLDAVLAAYRNQFSTEMPIDVWNVHAFILREERGSWGVDIPPGLPDDYGALYGIDDGDDMDIFRQQIVDFRRWMAERGYQNHPLIVSEYGILMPADYGFSPGRVTAFLWNSFDFFSTATDPALGYPQDNYRLVQRWCWYSLNAPDAYYPTGRLFDPTTHQMTAVGMGWAEYVGKRTEP